MYFLIGILTVLILFLTHTEIKRRRLSKKFAHIPGPVEHPIIGSVLSMKEILRNNEKYFSSNINKFTIGDRIVLVLSDPDALQEILQSQTFLKRPFPFDFFEGDTALFTTKCTLN